MTRFRIWWALLLLGLLIFVGSAFAMTPNEATQGPEFPPSLESYDDGEILGIGARLAHRAAAQPFNLVATGIFLLAILHTFFSSRFLAMAHQRSVAHKLRQASGDAPRNSVSHSAELFHFFGEVEAIFGIWAVALGVAVVAF